MKSSKWYFNSVFYQIYPQSFQDSNNDGIGDLDFLSLISFLTVFKIDTGDFSCSFTFLTV